MRGIFVKFENGKIQWKASMALRKTGYKNIKGCVYFSEALEADESALADFEKIFLTKKKQLLTARLNLKKL